MSPKPKAVKQRVDGVLLLDKAEGLSSNHALQQVKHLFCAAKAGHTGTLDPFASGLLPICFGEATKFSGFALDADKSYEATVLLGVSTDTADRDGRELQRQPVAVSDAQVEQALAGLRGSIRQTPPMYSALKKDGKALYEYARAGIEVEREDRSVIVHALQLLARRGAELDIAVTCSKGTYVRTLAEQIGAALGCGAHLSRLRRTASGAFHIAQAVSFVSLQGEDQQTRHRRLLPPDALVAGLPSIELTPGQAVDIGHGRAIAWESADDEFLARAYTTGRFLGLVCAAGGTLQARRLLSGDPHSEARIGLEASAV